jgi:hypothetical protein
MGRTTALGLVFTSLWLASAHAELKTNGRAVGCMDGSNVQAAEEAYASGLEALFRAL